VAEETLTVTVAQTASAPGDVGGNVNAAAQIALQAADAGAELLIFPELSLIGYDLGLLGDPSVWVTLDDPRLDPLREPPMATVVGAPYRAEDGAHLLASLVFRPDGEVAVHGKRHLHGPEREHFQPGRPADPFRLNGWRVALAICYDAGVPAHAQDAAGRGAEVYAASVLYTQEEVRRFDLHFAARAMDHRMYALAANHAGNGPGWESCGGSGVWHPDGRRLVQAGTEPALVTWTLSRAELASLRERDAQAGYPHSK
jgi:predicted amidohydrolase